MSINRLRAASEWMLMVALVFGAGALAQAQDEEAQPEGPVIQIGKDDESNAAPQLPPPNAGLNDQFNAGDPDQPQLPKYWIGLAAGAIPADHPLRAHVDIPENQGLLVASIVPDSPAAKAGVKQHDILLRANESELREMPTLVDLVLTAGEKKQQIALEVLRRGQRETIYITPEERPADAPRPQLGGGGFGQGFGGPGEGGLPQDMLRQFGGNNPFVFRQFGPGVILGDGQGIANLPNGVSVSIQKENDKPPRITVKRGDETWEVVGDDPESLQQLPEDLRPFVEQMLHGGGLRGFNLRLPGAQQPPMPELGDGRLRERLERMEQRMEELQKRLLDPKEDQPADEPRPRNDRAE